MDWNTGLKDNRVDRNGSKNLDDVATKLEYAKSALSSIVALCLSDGDPGSRLVRIALTAEKVLHELEER